MNKTPLNNLHKELGGKMVEFAGYEMPIQFEGIKAEHLWVRENAGLFDVSHMGQGILEGSDALEVVEKITPSPFVKTPYGKAKYTVLLNENGGIIDDLIITKLADDKFFFVYNAGCRAKDEAFIMSQTENFTPLPDRALLALQGSKAEEIISETLNYPSYKIEVPSLKEMPKFSKREDRDFSYQEYMTISECEFEGDILYISRLGYTGEDGFEISVSNFSAEELTKHLLANDNVKPIGLGARDSLRLEMGYPLYGHDISDETTPLEANLQWVVAKANRENFPAPQKLRVGIEILDRAPAREGTKIFSLEGQEIGVITSGGFSPTLEKPIAQGYVEIAFAEEGSEVELEVRGRKIKAKTHKLNFIEPRTK